MTDCVADTVDYGIVHQIVRRIGEEERFHLLEALAEQIASAVLQVPGVAGIRLCVRKHRPPLPGVVSYAAVNIERRASESADGLPLP